MPFLCDPVSFLRRLAVCLVVTLTVSACHDAEGDPLAVILTEETHSTLDLEGGLPSLPDLITRAGLEGELTGAVDLWLTSWDTDATEALETRGRADDEASGPVARALGPAAVRSAHARVGAALAAVDELPQARLSAAMVEELEHARRLHRRADALLDGGRDGEVLSLNLRAADALRTVGPEGVARMLTARAQRAFDERRREAASDPALDRGERLLLGAHLALERGDWSRATRRAYYACQVLGVSPS